MKHRGSEIICRLLERQGVEVVAGIPGGSNLPLYDALRDSAIRHVLARHEQGAGFIAQGMARVTGRPGVCLATSGPGATNLLTAIADAKLDSVPLVAIMGQVPLPMIGTDAFQEVDTYGLTLPITKHNFLVRSAAELLEVIPLAFTLAASGRPGPVVVDVPKDVQTASIEVGDWPEPGRAAPPAECDGAVLDAMAERIRRAERPVLYLGGGVAQAGAGGLARELAHRMQAPVVCTLMGLGAVPCDDPLCLGMLGMHGARHTNLLMDEADLLVVAGARFDDRATGRAAEFCRHADILHIDIDASEIDKIKKSCVSLAADAGLALEGLLARVAPAARPAWAARLAALRAADPAPPAGDDPLLPQNLIRLIGEVSTPDTVVSTDVGQHQMWTAQGYPFRRPRRLLTSGGLGTMGFGLPAAIGAALARPDLPVVCVSGDGSILMNVQELATLAELDLNVKVVVMNNAHLGLVRQQQELFYQGRYFASSFSARPDFAAIARGFGLRGVDLGACADPAAALRAALSAPGPCLVNAPVHETENVLPMVPPGAANREMIGGSVHAN